MYFLLFYEKATDYAGKQVAWQAAHRDHVQAAAKGGALLLAGSLGDPDDGAAMLVFRADSAIVAERFAQTDPYVIAGIISRWWIRPWAVVAGTLVPEGE